MRDFFCSPVQSRPDLQPRYAAAIAAPEVSFQRTRERD